MSKLWCNSSRSVVRYYQKCREIEMDDYCAVERIDRINIPYPIIYAKNSRSLCDANMTTIYDSDYRISPMKYRETYRAIYNTAVRRITNDSFRYNEISDDKYNPFTEYDPMSDDDSPFVNYDWEDILGIGDCKSYE